MTTQVSPTRLGSGLLIALTAAAAFGMGGPFVKTLFEAGWTPAGGVLWRTAGASVLLAIPALIVLRGRWGILRRNLGTFAAYGIFAVVGAQLCFYNALEHMSVGLALLIEYLAPVFLVLFVWARSRKHPGWFVIAGSVVALGGLALVLDLAGTSTPDLIGVAWALTASLGVCVYYVISARVDDELPPIVLTAGSMVIGTVFVGLLGLTGLAPVRMTFGDATLFGETVSWLVPAAVILGMSTIAGYLLGIAGTARLGSRIASFVGLTEVLFAVLASWLMLGELPVPIQFAGGALIVLGVVLVKSQRERVETDARGAPGASVTPVAAPALADAVPTSAVSDAAPAPAAAPTPVP